MATVSRKGDHVSNGMQYLNKVPDHGTIFADRSTCPKPTKPLKAPVARSPTEVWAKYCSDGELISYSVFSLWLPGADPVEDKVCNRRGLLLDL